MKKLLIIAAACLSSAALWAQPEFHVENADQKLGEIMFQVPQTVVYNFRNTGNEPLIVTEVHPSCGCIHVSYPEKAIGAGKSAAITAVYDAAMLGTTHRELAVYTNAGEEPVYLSFGGKVVATPSEEGYATTFPVDLGNVRLSTNAVEFDDVNKGDEPVVELLVLNADDEEAYTPQLMHLPAYLSAEYYPETLRPGRVGRIRLTLESSKLVMDGLNQTSIYLARKTGDKVSEKNEIEVSAVLLPSFSNLSSSELATAPRLVLMDGEQMLDGQGDLSDEHFKPNLTFSQSGKKKKAKLTKVVNVTNIGDSPLEIKALQVFSQAISVSLGDRVVPAHGTTKLKITLDTKEVERAKSKPRLLIISNDPRHAKTVLNLNVE